MAETFASAFYRQVAAACGFRTLSVAPWAVDTGTATGDGKLYAGTGQIAAVDITGVINPAPAAVYRQGWTATDTTISWVFNGLPPLASFKVRFHFATPAATAEGVYSFTAAVVGNATVTQAAVDPVARVGAGKGDVLELVATSTDAGVLTCNVTDGAGKGVLCGLEIEAASSSPTSNTVPAAPSTPSATSNTVPAAPSTPTAASNTVPAAPSTPTAASNTVPSAPTTPSALEQSAVVLDVVNLRLIPAPLSGAIATTLCRVTPGDGLGRIWDFNAASTTADNGTSIVGAYTVGRWIGR